MTIWHIVGIIGLLIVVGIVVIGYAVMRVCGQCNRAHEPYEWMGD